MLTLTKAQYREAMEAIRKARVELQRLHEGIRNIDPDARASAALAMDRLSEAETRIAEQPLKK
jgi:hypothetical protein